MHTILSMHMHTYNTPNIDSYELNYDTTIFLEHTHVLVHMATQLAIY